METPPSSTAAGDPAVARKYAAEIRVEADTLEDLRKALKAAGDKMKDHVEDLDSTHALSAGAGAGPWKRMVLWRGGRVETGSWDVKTARN